MANLLLDYYRCPSGIVCLAGSADLQEGAGYFQFGPGTVGYGRLSVGKPSSTVTGPLPEMMDHVQHDGSACILPFDPLEVLDNLRQERYLGNHNLGTRSGLVRQLYYLVRPLLPVSVRKHLQRAALRDWETIAFPRWPVDRTADQLAEQFLALAMAAAGAAEVPFVWFWPDGHGACAVVTHDVEEAAGRDFCPTLMDMNDEFRIKSSFQVVPEERYTVPDSFLDGIRRRGFEVNIHDLNHDGHLFRERQEFLRRLAKIHEYGKAFGARGFRSAVLYRNPEWLHELHFEYDMSVPNVAHLDPQRGGCCTLLPYFVGDVLEIPLTATQDYSLFHILSDYSTRLWEQQIRTIVQAHGMVSFNIHPDYIIEKRARATYQALLQHLSDLRANEDLWIAQPGEINDWWRARAQMELVREGGTWRIEGPGSERASIAYAQATGDGISYRVEKSAGRRAVEAGKQ